MSLLDLFMATKEEKSYIKRLLESLFSKDDNISFFFLKKSKIKPEYEYQIPFKTKKKVSTEKVNSLQRQLQKDDDLISGWTAYWNDVFQLKNPLHPNYVKALMATESTFDPKARAPNSRKIGPARGLLQLTEETTRLAKNHKRHEYRDHFIDLEYEELWDPSKNISFGVRHLFRKRETAKARLKREPTWFEVLMDYKGMLKSNSNQAKKVNKDLTEYLELMRVNIE
jgi:soluble lytic murein transglycosylase-like protein